MLNRRRRNARNLLLLPLLLTGCAGAWKTTYVSASVTSKLVEDTHRTWWAEPLGAKIVECNPDTRPDIKTTTQYDACLGVYMNNARVLAALEAYNNAMAALEKVLLATNPETATDADKAKLRHLWRDVTLSATQLLALLPDGTKHVATLNALTR
jgi:hypothetical protein